MSGLEPLLNLGAIGAVLAWFLVNLGPRLERIERAIDRLTRAQMLTLLSRPDVPEPVKRLAGDLVKELDHAQAQSRREAA
jgi:hypothetical protein